MAVKTFGRDRDRRVSAAATMSSEDLGQDARDDDGVRRGRHARLDGQDRRPPG